MKTLAISSLAARRLRLAVVGLSLSVMFWETFAAFAKAVTGVGGIELLGGTDPNNGGANGGATDPNNGGGNTQPTDPNGGNGQPGGEVATLTHAQANMARMIGGVVTGSSAQPGSGGNWVDSITVRGLTGRTFAAGNLDQFGNPTGGGDLEGIELGPEQTVQLSQPVFVPDDESARAAMQSSLSNSLATLNADLQQETLARDMCQKVYYENPQDQSVQALAMQGYQQAVTAIGQLQAQSSELRIQLAAIQR